MNETIVRKVNGIREVGIAGINSDSPVSVRAMPIWQLILIRVLRTYISSFLGLLTFDGLGIVDLNVTYETWNTFAVTAVVALGPAFISCLQNALEFLTYIDVKNPGWRA